MSRFDNLSDWLRWLEELHPKSIDLGLERVYTVAKHLDLLIPPSAASEPFSGRLHSSNKSQVITVAGTNGKGSCIATLEQLLLLSNKSHSADTPMPAEEESAPRAYSVGSYTSPHLHHYCERICLDGEPVSEALVCDAFSAIDQARGELSLTYFEFGTLAALWIFVRYQVPYVLLEVGLGGRLDAVNIVDADIAVITSIDIDHEEWLGNDRDVISQEKLGVSRLSSPLIIAETRLTPSLQRAGEREQCSLIGRDFSFKVMAQSDDAQQTWRVSIDSLKYDLPLPSLPLASVAAALVALKRINKLPGHRAIECLMQDLSLPGRFETSKKNGIELIYDVAHNPAAANALAARLALSARHYNKTYAVVGTMSDKDHYGILSPLLNQFDMWFLGGLPDIPRAASAASLSNILLELNVDEHNIFVRSTVEIAFESALAAAGSHDRIVIFGSFYTVAAVQHFLL